MHHAYTQCTVQETEEAKGQRKLLCFSFPCLAMKYEFYFTKSPLSFNVLPQNLTQYPFLGPQQDHNPGFPWASGLFTSTLVLLQPGLS